MRTVIVVNPNAGRQNILREIDGVKKAFAETGSQVDVVETQSAEEAAHIIRQAVDSRPDLLVCCGGDGTLNETVGLVVETGAPVDLGYIPAGTTNDFASFLGIPKEPLKAAERIIAGQPRQLDVGLFEGRCFIYIASFGAFTQSSYNTNQSMKNALGHFAYVLEGLKELPALKTYKVKVETAEGRAFEGEYIFGALSNSTSVGGIMKLDAEQVDPADGRFELILVKSPKNLMEFNRIAMSLMSGKYDEELITFVHTAGASFTCEQAMPWSLDGEYAPGGERVEAKVLPRAVRLYY